MAELLNDQERTRRLGEVPGWQIENDGLTRTFTFPDFVTAFGFMASAAIVAEKLNHHPEWSNVWNRVEVRLTTHDAGGITAQDLELADFCDGLAEAG